MDHDKARLLQQQIKKLEDEIKSEEAKHKSTKNELDLTQHELNREKSRNVDLQNSVATARGSENSAVKRRGESLATLSEARLAVKTKDEEYEALTSAWRQQRKTLINKFIELTQNRGKIKEVENSNKEIEMKEGGSSISTTVNNDECNNIEQSNTSTSAEKTNQTQSLEADEQLLKQKKMMCFEWLRCSVDQCQGIITFVNETIVNRHPDAFADFFEATREENPDSIREQWNEFQRQCEENFELSQIYEAQLQENDPSENNESMMYDQEQYCTDMEQN